VDEWEISLIKSRITLQYPLTYARSFNARPREVVLTADGGGRAYNWLTNPCVDDPAVNGACGWVLDANGNRVLYSQGFCCRCDAADVLTGATSVRGGTQCGLLSSNAQSAHCMRMGPLWYAAYNILSPQVGLLRVASIHS